MKNSKISIIVPVYNVEKYLKECIESLINQTYKDLEILLIDDGSKDNSGKICDEYANKDKRIKVIHQENSGVSKTRNYGIELATGDYVMFVDSDDWLEENTCELLIKEIKTQNKDMIIFNFCKEFENKCIRNANYQNISDDFDIKKIQAKILAPTMNVPGIAGKGYSLAVNKIILKDVIKNNRFLFEGKKSVYEDGLFYYLLLENKIKIGFLNEYLYHYRIIPSSLSHSYNKDIFEINDIIVKNINNQRNNHKNDSYYDESFAIRKMLNIIYVISLNINTKINKKNILYKRKQIKQELEKAVYRDIYTTIRINNLDKKLKIYYLLFRYKMYFMILIVNTLEKRIKHV